MVAVTLYGDYIVTPLLWFAAFLAAFFAVVVVINIKKSKKEDRIQKILANTFTLIAIGIILWFIGDLIWDLHYYILNAVPYPSAADIPYVIGYFFLIPAFIYFSYTILKEKKEAVNTYLTGLIAVSVIFGTAVVYILSVYVAPYQVGQTILQTFLDYMYAVGDLVLGVLAVSLFVPFKKLKIGKPLLYIALGALLIFVADTMYIYGEWTEIYPTPYGAFGVIADTAYLLGWIGFAVGFYIFARKTKKLT